ncbi:MAG TPA: hypothetical protein DCY94_04210, partial [Firmicutes bacterium]|nr:hypothetical protein [Bacillota bacterium]
IVKADTSLKYKEVEVFNEKREDQKGETLSKTFIKPYFKEKILDDFIDSYIENNSCLDLEYTVYDMKNGKVNVFLDCGSPKNIVYDYKNKKELSFESIVKRYPEFLEKSRDLLKLKYPTFHVEDIDFDNASYDIRESEIVGHYDSKEFGPANYKINNNEIKDFMDYDMNYDDAYENETFKLDPNKQTIAFTYDDGPSTYDLNLVELLSSSHSSATFFMVGNRIANFPTAVEKLVSSGMEIGNHTYDHKSLTSLSNTKVTEEIAKTNELFESKTGKKMTSLRPSYGAVNKRVAVQVGMPIVLWNIDTLDWKWRNADKVFDEIMKNAKDGEIVLMHSLYKTTVEATDRAIKELYKRGFQIVSVEQLAKLKGKTLLPGNTYLSIK